jgi:hypothetical protein
MSTDHRLQAKSHIDSLATRLRELPAADATVGSLIEECEALSRAIGAFHMEGIRFRMYNVDRLLHQSGLSVPPEALGTFTDARRELEAAGFHTRSHQSPS